MGATRSGIGRATAVAFTAAGASVTATGLDAESAAETVRLTEVAAGTATAVGLDVTDAAAIQAALQTTVDRIGGPDSAFSDAGIEQEDAPLAETADAHRDRIIATDVRGVFLCMKAEIPLLQARGGDAIVDTSSGPGGLGIKGQVAYAAAQHPVLGLTRSLRCTTPTPESTFTRSRRDDRHRDDRAPLEWDGGGDQRGISQEPIGRPGRPEEIAAAVLFLSPPRNAFMIGHTLVMIGHTLVMDGHHTIQ